MTDMNKITREIHIKAPVEKVFSFLSNPYNLAEIWPNLIDISDLKESHLGGASYKWTYKMSGVRFEGRTEPIEFLTNRRLVTKSSKGLDNLVTWNFEPNGDQTIVSLEIEYRIPTSLLVRLNEPILVQENAHVVDAMLENLKTRLELEMIYA